MTNIVNPTGVKGYIKYRKVCMGTRESLPPPHEPGSVWADPTQIVQARQVSTSTCNGDKKRGVPQVVSVPRETEGKEMGEGSLSILILPIESWKISPMKASE